MLPFIGPEFIAHLLNGLPHGEHRAGTPPAPRDAFDKPKFSLKVRLTLVEIARPEKNRTEKASDDTNNPSECLIRGIRAGTVARVNEHCGFARVSEIDEY